MKSATFLTFWNVFYFENYNIFTPTSQKPPNNTTFPKEMESCMTPLAFGQSRIGAFFKVIQGFVLLHDPRLKS